MSLLVEIAEKAHVSVEGVVRVLTREPVSDAIKERVLGVLDDLDPEQTRVLQRFALAALHDALPRPHEGDLTEEPAHTAGNAGLPLLPAPPPEDVPELLPAAPQDAAHLVQLSSVLTDLADAVRDLRRETDTERRERVDDLAVLIELISTGWQGLDRRLGRLERQLGRLETARTQQPPVAPRPPRAVQPPPPAPPAPPPPVALPSPPAEPSPRGKRDRLPLGTALVLVGLTLGAVTVQLIAGEPDGVAVSTRGIDAVATAAETPERTTPATTEAATTTTEPAGTRSRTVPEPSRQRPAPATTAAVLGTQATAPTAPAETTPARTEEPARRPAATAPTTAVETEPEGFQPARDWAWAPVAGADYYAVQFLRAGTTVYRTTTEEARLTLPDSVVFRPGSYRWIVRPGVGPPSENQLGTPVVDSTFTV